MHGLQLLDSCGGYHDITLHLYGDDYIARGARVEQALGVVEHCAQRDATCGLVNYAADGLYYAALFVLRAVDELQAHGGHGLHGGLGAAGFADLLEQLSLGHREVDVHLMVVRHGGQGRGDRRPDEGADTVGQCAHDAVGGTLDDGVGQAVGGIRHGSSGLCHGSLGLSVGIVGRLKVEITDDLLVEEVLGALVAELGRSLGSLGGLQVGTGGVQGCLIRHLVDDEERLPFRHLLTLGDAQTLQRAADLRQHLDVLATTNGGAVLGVDGAVLGLDLHGLVRNGRIGHALLLLTLA